MGAGDIAKGIHDAMDVPYNIDYATLEVIVAKTGDIVGLLMGFIAVFLVVGLTLITALDIVYLTIPIFQQAIQEKSWDGSSDRTKIQFVSNDARTAVERAAISNQSSLWIYMKLRFKTYLIAAVILFLIMGFSDPLVHMIQRVVGDIVAVFMSKVH